MQCTLGQHDILKNQQLLWTAIGLGTLHLIDLLMEPRQHASRVGAHGRLLVAQALQHGGFEGLEEVLQRMPLTWLHMLVPDRWRTADDHKGQCGAVQHTLRAAMQNRGPATMLRRWPSGPWPPCGTTPPLHLAPDKLRGTARRPPHQGRRPEAAPR